MLNIVPSINSEETYYGVSHVNNDILLQSASACIIGYKKPIESSFNDSAETGHTFTQASHPEHF